MDDRDLTRRLAALMGWTIYNVGDYADWMACIEHGNADGTAYIDERGRVWVADSRIWRGNEWRPLDSMDDAWMVVERLIEQGWDYTLASTLMASGEGHSAVFERGKYDPYEDLREETHGIADPTPARALCLAALAAGEGV